jgi:hypothetical protein
MPPEASRASGLPALPGLPSPTLLALAQAQAWLARPGLCTIKMWLHVQVKQWVDAAQSPGTLNRVLSLQLEAFWQQHGNTVMVAGALAVAYAIW